MTEKTLTVLQDYSSPKKLASISSPSKLVTYAERLPGRDQNQLEKALRGEQYDIACVFAWYRTIEALRRQLDGLGEAFFEEILLVNDSNYDSNVISLVSEGELISIAEEIGYLTSTEALRLRHAQETIQHFSNPNIVEEDEELTKDEAIQIVRSCIQGVLGKPEADLSEQFRKFLAALENESLEKDDTRVRLLLESQYFFWRAAIGVILNKFRSAKGAQIEHIVRNAIVIVPELWPRLKANEKWQIGRAYAELYADGNKKAVSGLKSVLTRVSGFDYVPENLRSSTFADVAHKILRTHESVDNFYKEPAVVRELYSLGSTIPAPAFPVCITAVLAVWLGNQYGYSFEAESTAKKVLVNLSSERWEYYIREVLPQERIILAKLSNRIPAKRFQELANELDLKPEYANKKLVKDIFRSAQKRQVEGISESARKQYRTLRK